jgi:hypothetical protein
MPDSPLRSLAPTLAALATLLSIGAVASAEVRTGPAMEISHSEARPPNRGPANWFTGAVTVAPLFDPKGASQVGGALVRFEPGARTAWHKHPLG